MLRKILALFGFGWRRLGDASTFSWILPATWGSAVSVLGGAATAVLAAIYRTPPYLWIPFTVLVALGVLAAVNLYYLIRERRHGFGVTSPPSLQIQFDPSNPARRHWSFESPRDADGNALPGLLHEYRVAVFNPTSRTVRNVGVNVEFLGPSGPRPYKALFDKDRSAHLDIHPGCFELAQVLHWPHPKKRAGDFIEPTSFVAYGPMVVTASGDDVAPVTRQFWFSHEREPMLFDSLTSEEEEHVKALLARP